MSVKLLTEHHMEFLSLTGGCTCSSESTLVKMPLCWKSHAMAQIVVEDVGGVTFWLYKFYTACYFLKKMSRDM